LENKVLIQDIEV